jgi:hypothetical protein
MDTILRYLTLVKEAQQNIRRKKAQAVRDRRKESSFEEAGEEAGLREEGITGEEKKREEA